MEGADGLSNVNSSMSNNMCYKRCPGALVNGGFIEALCSKSSNSSMKGRCCIEKRCDKEIENCSEVIIG